MSNYFRLWATGLAQGQGARFDELAASHSVPLFKSIPGCLGAVFARSDRKAYVLTTWTDAASAEAAQKMQTYIDAVQAIARSGILAGEQSLEQITIADGFAAAPGIFR